ncbi:hypothetical protein CBR_g32614 [Chara braunii]|uniref:Integrase catalytic domain-containing protein n=1 Tax=Chara braunii TaxID=69332 RepID=A0A388LHD7_CHABU|nr:hypothetical protein CBR_g32614 [Chara braunii]|eukprot:GBG81622.1 hypothetical protein CBR_g32614 [Chara braunii]
MSDEEVTQPDDRILRSARRPIAHVGDRVLFRQLRERQQQQRRARAAETSKAFASEAAVSAAMATSAQQSSQASSSGAVGSTVAQTQSQSTGVMASQPIVLTPEEVAIQRAALREAQLQQALGEIKAEKEKIIRRRARMQRREVDVSELEQMNMTNMHDDVRTLRSVLLHVVVMLDHQTTLLQDIQQSLAVLLGRVHATPSPSGPGAWPVVHPPPYVPPVTGVSPYVAPASVPTASPGMPLTGGFSAGPSLQVPVHTVFTQPPSQPAVTGQLAVSQPAQSQGTRPQQTVVQQPARQGPHPGVGQVPGQTQWLPKTAIAAPKPFTGDKRGEDLDTWLRAVPVYVKCTLTVPHEEVFVAASYLEGSAARWVKWFSMYYLSVAQPQFDSDRKVVKHTLPGGGPARLRKFKASSLIESYGCMCEATFYNYYKQNPEEGMYLVYVSAAGEPMKMSPEIEGVVAKYPDLFEEPTRVVEREVVHAIEIIPESPIPKGRIYRMSPGELDELRRQLKELVEKGWIRPSVSPYGLPVLFVPKKGGTLRMCIDYRGLNAITVKNRDPLPRIDDLLDRVHGCRYFSKINLKSGYHQIAIRPEDQPKTAFQTRYGLYEFVVMPFGLCNIPGTFQHAMNRIFHDYLDKFVIVYLDDILIFRTVEEHVAHLDKVLSLLRQHKFKINGEKCEFGRTRILYLGHEISAEGLKPDDAKVASIRDWPRPQYVTEMTSFLRMASYYRTFVKNYSIVAAPLTDLTRLDTPWEWTDECEAAFRHLKHALTHYEVLKLPDLDKPFVVTTDASQYGIGAVLAQQEGPKLRPVEYMSKKMSSQKLAKSMYEKELYLVYKALTHWRHYLLGRFFIPRTDHQTLRWMRTQSVLSDALKCWIEVIEQYDFDPQYMKGEYNKVADALSRRPDLSDAQLYVETCQVCQRDKPRTQAPLGLLKPLPIPERPGESLSMDFMDTLVTRKSGMRHIFVIADRFSKYARLVAMPETAKTEYVIRLFKENLVRVFGPPKSIVSDKDVRFTSELWKAAAAEQATQLQMTSGNHPEANGQAEQLNHAVGDRVWVKSSELGQEYGISRRLMPQYFGPWEVLDIAGTDPNGPSYVIRIPGHLRTYPVFHASKLAPFKETDQFPSRCSMSPPTMDGEVDVDDIVDHTELPVPRPTGRGRPLKPKLQYRVRFRHHINPKEDRWFTRKELMQTAPHIVAQYKKSLRKGKRQIIEY